MAKPIKLNIKPIYMWRMLYIVPTLLIIIAVVTYLIYANFTVEQADQLEQLQQNETQLKDELTNKYKMVKSVDLYKDKLTELNKLESSLNAQFPSSDDLPDLLIQINQLAEDANVTIISLLPTSGDDNKSVDVKITSKNFHISANGTYSDFCQLILAMAKFQKVFKISNVNISQAGNNKINISFDITIYYSS